MYSFNGLEKSRNSTEKFISFCSGLKKRIVQTLPKCEQIVVGVEQ